MLRQRRAPIGEGREAANDVSAKLDSQVTKGALYMIGTATSTPGSPSGPNI